MLESPPLAPSVEELLRGSAPALPIALKKRTLHGCATRAADQRHKQDRLHWQLTWLVAGVLALQALTVCLVDAQNTRLISGNSTPPPYTPITIAEVTALWQHRSRQVALMMAPSKLG